ncbi:MAG: hypothetical protein M0T84_05270 [Betaproteobacteria bacterium]|nr:hypothetical protein [Betaproteobacteria bacterium]
MHLISAMLQHIWTVTISAIVLLGIAFLAWSKYTKSLLGKDFWVALPVVGRMSEWKKMNQGTGLATVSVSPNAGYVERTLVVPAERALYDYYDESVAKTSSRGFFNSREYLKITGQNGRKPMSSVVWVILALLTVAEALGTGLLVAPLLSNELTPSLAMIAGSIIAMVIASVAVIITHGAGEDLYANTLLAKVRGSYRQHGGFRMADGSMYNNFGKHIGPEDDQEQDETLEASGRLARRINAMTAESMQSRKGRIIAAVAFIVLFAIGTTVYRHYVFNKQQDQSAMAPAASPDAGSANFSNMFSQSSATAGNMPLPTAVAQAAQQSEHRAKQAVANDSSDANNAGILVLALIYVFTQLLGLLTGYKYSFYDEDGRKAYEKTLGQIGYEDFLRVAVQPVAQRAQMRLGQLRSKLSNGNPEYSKNMRQFDFMMAYHESAAKADAVREADKRRKEPDTGSPTPLQSVAAQPAVAPAAAPAGVLDVAGVDLEKIGRAIAEIQDPEVRRRTAADLIRQHALSAEHLSKLKAIIQHITEEKTSAESDFLSSI